MACRWVWSPASVASYSPSKGNSLGLLAAIHAGVAGGMSGHGMSPHRRATSFATRDDAQGSRGEVNPGSDLSHRSAPLASTCICCRSTSQIASKHESMQSSEARLAPCLQWCTRNMAEACAWQVLAVRNFSVSIAWDI